MIPGLVIFDCDGVIVDSEKVANALLVEELNRHGLKVTLHQVEANFVGGTLQRVEARAREMGADLPEGWAETTYEELYARLGRGTPLVQGVEAVLDRLDAAGVRYAVGSNGEMRKMEITLSQHPSVRARLEGRIFSGREVGALKPDPALYLHIAEVMGVAAAGCVVVEDSETGATAAQRAGMRCLGYAPEGDGAALARVGAEVFREMAALPGLLGL